jgi:hypothetical protein
MLQALVTRVEKIVPSGEPEWGLNNIIRRLHRLPLELVPA